MQWYVLNFSLIGFLEILCQSLLLDWWYGILIWDNLLSWVYEFGYSSLFRAVGRFIGVGDTVATWKLNHTAFRFRNSLKNGAILYRWLALFGFFGLTEFILECRELGHHIFFCGFSIGHILLLLFHNLVKVFFYIVKVKLQQVSRNQILFNYANFCNIVW